MSGCEKATFETSDQEILFSLAENIKVGLVKYLFKYNIIETTSKTINV